MSVTSEQDFEYIRKLVLDRAAIVLEPGKVYLAESRLTPVARKAGLASLRELVDQLRAERNGGGLTTQVVEAMTTNETSFFRDAHPFEALRTTIVPNLLKTNAARRSLNIWSAACSTGQEAYSIAMLLREHFAELATWNVRILGTDLSDEVLGKASAGRFSQLEINRGLPAALLAKYFRREGMQWEIVPTVRAWATFTKLNLIEPWPAMPRMDVVFLRNVLIYFSPDTKRLILEKIRKVMAPHAVLFLGAAETTMGLDASFERVQVNNAVFYRLK